MPIPPGGGGGGGCIPIMPPTPCTGAAPSPIGAAAARPPLPAPPLPPLAAGGGNAPRPTPRATPGPPADEAAAALGGGGPSTATLTTFSPRKMIRPSVRFSTRSSIIALPVAFFFLLPFEEGPPLLACRYSSASTRTKFKCLSKARNVPTIVLPSTNDTRSRCSMYRSNFDPLLPVGIMAIYFIGGEGCC